MSLWILRVAADILALVDISRRRLFGWACVRTAPRKVIAYEFEQGSLNGEKTNERVEKLRAELLGIPDNNGANKLTHQ